MTANYKHRQPALDRVLQRFAIVRYLGRRKRRSKMKNALILALIAILGLALAAAWVMTDLKRFADAAADPQGQAVVTVIHAGDSLDTISTSLERNGLVTSALSLRLLARLRGLDKRIKAGEYRLSGAMSPAQILDMIVAGRVILHRITIPEGLTLRQIVRLLADALPITEAQLQQAAEDKKRFARFGIAAGSLEGYLFPDTYHFAKQTPAGKVIDTMLMRFDEVFIEKWRARATELGMSVHKILTLASIIEKETGLATERKLISSVFHNRLRRRMRLESDPTVIYGIPDFNGNLTRKDLRTPTPYNTYRIRGLPPGPIANPGAASIEAALYPVQSRFLYFVSKRDRSHHFSATLAEHNRAVRKYQLRR